MQGNTQIQLEDKGILTVQSGTNFPLNFNIQNLKKPDSTPASYSKDIIIIGDKDANKLLGQLFDVNISNATFNINKKIKCNVIQEGANVFENANFQLLGVTKTGKSLPNGESEIQYKARVKSDLVDFFTIIKNKDLDDLDIYTVDDYTTLTKANIKNTFTNTHIDKYKFIPHWKNGNSFPLKYFKPATYAKTFFDYIHKSAGWEYEFVEMSELKFDKLLIPYTGGFQVDESVKDYATVIGEDTTVRQYDYGCDVGYDLELNINNASPKLIMSSTTQDNFNQYDEANSIFTADFNSEYTFDYTFEFEHFLENGTSKDVSPFGQDIQYSYELYYVIERVDGSLDTGTVDIPFFGRVYENSIDILPPGLTSTNSGSGSVSFTIELAIGDKVKNLMFREWITNPNNNSIAKWHYSSPITFVTICSKVNISNTSLKVKPDLGYDINSPIFLDKFIPKDIKQRDYIKSIIDMYKLIVDVDPQQSNKLIYKTRDKYYDTGEEKDWTKKLAKGKDIELQWLVNTQPKNRTYTYKSDDSDTYNRTYQEITGEVFGEYEFDFENEYNVGEEKIELIFSPTPTRYNQYSNMYIPNLSAEAEHNIRILIDGGVRTDGFYHLQNDDGSYPNSTESDYPYVGHFDDPITPSFDLNFGPSAYYFYQNYKLTQNNLWNQYHRRYVSQLFSGKLMYAYLNLTPIDILNFKLSDRIFINDSWYNVNKIIDYNANNNTPTKIEFVTVDDGLSISPERIVRPPYTPGKGDPWVSRPSYEQIREQTFTDNVLVDGSNVTVKGEGNVAQTGSKGYVVGDDNNISGKGGLIIGDNNNDNGLPSIFMLGSNKEANVDYNAYIGDVSIGSDINIGDTYFTNVGMTNNAASVIFGGTSSTVIIDADTVDMSTVTTLDLTNVTVDGMPSTLAEVLTNDNITGGNHIITSDSDYITALNGTAKLDLRHQNIDDRIFLAQDDGLKGFLLMRDDFTQLIHNGTNSDIQIYSNRNVIINTSTAVNLVGSNSFVNNTTISTTNPTFDSTGGAISDTVILGGANITATKSNTVYMQHSVNTGVHQLAEYTVLTLPTASNYKGGLIAVSDETGGYTMAFSDGTDWRRVQDRNIVS